MHKALIAVDGEQIQFPAHASGQEYEIMDSHMSGIRILPCLRDLAGNSSPPADMNETISLTVTLEEGLLPWEDDCPWAFFNFKYRKNDEFIANFPLATALGSQYIDIPEIIEPLLADKPYTLSEIHRETKSSYSDLGSHLIEVLISCTSEHVTFGEMLALRRLASQALFLPGRFITTPYMARRVLQLGQADRLIGHRESEWLEVKSAPYEFKNVGDYAWRLELAKDVAQFANTQDGGILVIGLHTRRRDGVDTIDKVTAFPYDEKRIQSYGDILKSRIYPPISAIEIEGIRDGDLCIIYVYVPAQPEENKPYLVTGATIDGEFESFGITIPRRHGDSSVPMSTQELHSIIAAGRAFLRGNQRKID